MANLKKIMEKKITTVDKINQQYEKDNIPRSRLGLSEIGHHCSRYLWFKHHGYENISPEGRVLRLFQLGNILEDQTIADLKNAGFSVTDGQKEVNFTFNNVTLYGHIDGIITGLVESPKTPHLFEHKTCSLKRYRELLKKKDYKAWSEVYFWQVQAYMLGLELSRSAVFVYCKDNSELYMERIKLNKTKTIGKLTQVFDAISLDSPPDRVCPNAGWYQAKMCDFRKICFK